MTSVLQHDVIRLYDVIRLLLLVHIVATHDSGVPHSGVVMKEGEGEPYSLLRYKTIEYLNTQENEQVICKICKVWADF